MGIGIGVITNPVNRIIGLSAWSIAFALILGAINGWYMQSVDAGVVSNERFDRVVVAGSLNSGDAWGEVTALEGAAGALTAYDGATAYKVLDSCEVAGTGTAVIEAASMYTPQGTKVNAHRRKQQPRQRKSAAVNTRTAPTSSTRGAWGAWRP